MEGYEKYVGAVLDGRYKIDKIIGVGGMAVVFRAYDMLMNRTVAIKMLKDEIARDAESVKRFVNESKAVAMMSHPNIVSIYDVNVRDDLKYIVMEYVEGITLKNYMTKRGMLTLREIISYTEQILSALRHAHSKGIVHRDIKPQNIMLLKNGIIKVTDFGIAKLPNAETVTVTDKAIGTVYYISPEQASGQEIDQRSDIYSLGAMMYEMATGELPFTADSPVSVAMMQINDTAKAPSEINTSMPKGLEQIIGIAMEKDPRDRYQSADEMLRQLEKLKENPNIVFKIPKKKSDEDDSTGVWSMLFGSGPMFPVIAGVALAFFIIFGIGTAFVLGRVNAAVSHTAQTITVANFTGSYYTDELASWFSDSDVYKVTVEYEYSDKYDQGYIIAQDPQPEASRKVQAGEQFCEITLTVCNGKQTVAVPDLTGLDYREARQKLKAANLICKVEYTEDDEMENGQVVSTQPAAGDGVAVGETVTVYVCKGSSEGEVEVPDFVGKTEKDALSELISLELLPGRISYVKSDKTRGTVISQTDEAGDKVSAHSRINLTVSGGPDYDPNDPAGTKQTTKAPETTAPKPKDTTTAAPVTTKVPETVDTSHQTEEETTGESNEPGGKDTTEPETVPVGADTAGKEH